MDARYTNHDCFIQLLMNKFVELFTDENAIHFYALRQVGDHTTESASRHREYELSQCSTVPNTWWLGGTIIIDRQPGSGFWNRGHLDITLHGLIYSVVFSLNTAGKILVTSAVTKAQK